MHICAQYAPIHHIEDYTLCDTTQALESLVDKMDVVIIIKILLMFDSICSSHHVFGETFYIATSSNTSCPEEYIGEPCLTLQQYILNPSSSSNVTLILESGKHWLQAHTIQSSPYSTDVDYFTLEAENAKVIFKTKEQGLNYYTYRLGHDVHNSESNSRTTN